MQTTLKSPASFEGVGLHSGRPAVATIRPALPGRGIRFVRTDVSGAPNEIPALWHLVRQSPLCTRLENEAGVAVATVEHVMAALVGCGVHNAVIEVDGPELPILDGSSAPFVRGILWAGLRQVDRPLRALKVLKPVEVTRGAARARLSPHDTLVVDFAIAFDDAAIGVQEKSLNLSNGSFVRELSASRTFCRMADVEAMRRQGLALGGTLENAVVVDGDEVLSPGGLRHADEAVRHKMLDAVGDLGLAGYPVLGHYQGERAGHAVTNALLHALFDAPDSYEIVTCDVDTAARLPGVGVRRSEIPDVA